MIRLPRQLDPHACDDAADVTLGDHRPRREVVDGNAEVGRGGCHRFFPLGSIRCAWLRMYSSTATVIKPLRGRFTPPAAQTSAMRMRDSFCNVSGLNLTLIGRPTFSDSDLAMGQIVAISESGGNTVATAAYMSYNNTCNTMAVN